MATAFDEELCYLSKDVYRRTSGSDEDRIELWRVCESCL